MEMYIERFADQGLSCGEGPIYDPATTSLFWTDAGGAAIYRKPLAGGDVTVALEGFHAAGLALAAGGGLIFGGASGFFHWSGGAPPTLLCNEVDGIRCTHINDIIADSRGRVLGGQEAFREDGPYNPGFLFGIDPDGQHAILEEGLHLSNGMGFCPAGHTFYLVDSIQRVLYAYDYRLETGRLANRRELIRFGDDDGLPDGMTVDAQGFIWVAHWFGGRVSRFDDRGKRVQTIRLPAAQISSVAFGGADYETLFVTSAAQYWESSLAPQRHDFSTHRGGEVYRIAVGVQGKPEHQAKLGGQAVRERHG